jgi:hypothetical protein
MVAVAYYGYGVSVTSQANKPAVSLKGAELLPGKKGTSAAWHTRHTKHGGVIAVQAAEGKPEALSTAESIREARVLPRTR